MDYREINNLLGKCIRERNNPNATHNNMKAITIYELIQKLKKFDSNCKVLIKNNELYVINPVATTVDDKDIEEYENYINSVENQDSIY